MMVRFLARTFIAKVSDSKEMLKAGKMRRNKTDSIL